MLNCNLGAQLDVAKSYTNPSGNIGAHCLQYQFGRKDPFPGVSSYDGKTATDVTIYGYGSSTIYYKSGFTIGNKKQASNATYNARQTLEYTIAHPEIYIYGANVNSQYNWIHSAVIGSADLKISKCLWGDNNSSSLEVNMGGLDPDPWGTLKENGKKTIYDPCPAGWRVAPADSWTGIAHDIDGDNRIGYWLNVGINNFYCNGNFNYGYTFKFGSTGASTYCPATGGRDAITGDLASIGTLGAVWMSAPSGSNSTYGTYLYSTDGVVHIVSDHRPAMGFPIRCVKIEY